MIFVFSVSSKKLQHSYDVWYRDANRGKTVSSSHNYDQNLKIVATFDTVQKFWAVYTHLVRPNELTRHSDLHIFKSGIKPLWEVSLPTLALMPDFNRKFFVFL